MDGLYAHLYTLTRDELAYIPDTFASASLSTGPIVRRKDEERWGEYRTKRLAIKTLSPGQTFAVTDLERACPSVSRATIRRVLGELRAQGQVECLGTGRSARWRRL